MKSMPDGGTSNVKTEGKEHRTSLSRGYSIPDTKVKRKLRVIVIGIKKLRHLTHEIHFISQKCEYSLS